MTPAPMVPVPTKPRWNTLRILKVSRVVTIGLVALLLVTVMVGTSVHRDAMKLVGKDSAPSIIAAQHIKSALADMDADAVNDLLEPAAARNPAIPAQSATTAAQSAMTRAYEARRVEAAKELLSAAENITFGDAERAPIQALQVGMGTYERLAGKARDLHETGNSGAIAAYLEASKLMDETLLPAADALDHANNDELEKSYEAQSSKSLGARALIIVTGLMVLLALAAVQGYLSYRTRRTLNPLLLVATMLALGLTVYSLIAMGQEQSELKLAKEDAFASIRTLWRARAIAYEANSEESRYLLDTAHAAEYQRMFAEESNSLATLPSAESLSEVLKAEANGHRVDGFSGSLADELNNITFPGERDAAISTLVQYEGYQKIDALMRQLEQHGQHKQAVELCLGTAQGQSNWAFEHFDQALGKTLDINQSAFDGSVDRGLSGLAGLEIKAALVAAVVAVLVFLGLAGRIREYE